MHELLLVEDDDALGRGIRLALEGGGLRVTVCRTLAEGRRALEDGAFRSTVMEAVMAAFEKTKALGKS